MRFLTALIISSLLSLPGTNPALDMATRVIIHLQADIEATFPQYDCRTAIGVSPTNPNNFAILLQCWETDTGS